MFDESKFQQFKNFFMNNDPKIYKLIEKHGYLKPTPKRNLYSILIGVIIGQKIRFHRARKLRGSLYTRIGTDNFSPTDILNLGLEGLMNLGIDKTPSETIIRVTKYFIEKEVDIKSVNELVNVKGIGVWTISCVKIMYTLNEEDSDIENLLLLEDLIIRRGMKDLYGTDKKDELKNIYEKWSPWKGIVTWYVWKEYTK